MSEYIKSPLNYTGGKYKLLPQILPLFPKDINMFVDLFGGGFNVGINVSANKICYNDMIGQLVELLKYFYENSTENLLSDIDKLIFQYNLTKENRDGFIRLREKYNEAHKDYVMLYVLICYAFNNQIRFNSKRDYNMPFGKDRSSFNDTLRSRFINFVNILHTKDIIFTNNDFVNLKANKLSSNDFVYCDPPYLNSTATYNEKDGWNRQHEQDLYNLLIDLNNHNIKWALSNNLTINPLPKDWCDENNFIIHYLNRDYSNCNYQKKDKISKDIEVLITNY